MEMLINFHNRHCRENYATWKKSIIVHLGFSSSVVWKKSQKRSIMYVTNDVISYCVFVACDFNYINDRPVSSRLLTTNPKETPTHPHTNAN